MTTRESLTFGVVWTLALAVIGLSIGMRLESRRAVAATAEALTWERKADAAATELAQAKEEIRAARQLAQEAAQAVQVLRARLDALPPVPPRPAAPPADPVALVAELRGLGLRSPELIEAERDRPLVWGWGQQALRVPALEGRLEASTALVAGLDHQVDALQAETQAQAKGLDAAAAQALAEHNRAEAFARVLRATPAPRPWAAGLLWSPATAQRPSAWGASVRRDLGPVFVEGVVFPGWAAVGAGWRF